MMFLARPWRPSVHDAATTAHRRGLRHRLLPGLLGASLTTAFLAGPAASTPAQAETPVSVVVQERPGAGPAVEQAGRPPPRPPHPGPARLRRLQPPTPPHRP